MKTNHHRPSFFQVVIVVLSVYVLAALLAESLLKLSPEVSRFIQAADTFICLVFLADFGLRFHKAENKFKFMKWGWIDLISSIPNVDVFRWGRLIRVFRILRAIRSAKVLVEVVFRKRTQGAMFTVGCLAVILMVFSSILILECEKGGAGNIRSGEDAIWWSLATITTVGYGNKFPVTSEGKLVGAVVMVFGIAIYATFTASIASLLLEKEEEKKLDTLIAEVRILSGMVEELKSSREKKVDEDFDRRMRTSDLDNL
jgi:voltage-gated potassium channel